LADNEKPPVSFVAGSDAVEWATTGAIKQRQAQLDEWRDLRNTAMDCSKL